MAGKSMVSSLSIAFKKATYLTEDREEAKKEHRQTLKNIVDKYIEDVQSGKADGIRNAKELVEVMKMDLLLMGEATERTNNTNDFDEVRVQKISQVLDLNSESIRSVMADMIQVLNDTNDEADTGTNKKSESDDVSGYDGLSIMASDEDLMEIANQAMQDYIDSQEDEVEEE